MTNPEEAKSGAQPLPEALGRSASTPLREFLAGLLGIAIALACVLPPLLHLITGPTGPFIAGFVVSRHLRPEQRGRAIIALTIGAGMAGIAALIAFAVAHFGSPKSLPDWFPSPDMMGLIVAGVGAYAGMLSFAGTLASAAIGRRESKEAEPKPSAEPAQSENASRS